VKLVYYEQHELIAHAFYREKKIQGWTHGKKRKLVREGPGVQVEDDMRIFE
jgi:putative endonuclease